MPSIAFDTPIAVPRDVGNNLDFRVWIARKGAESRSTAAALRELCKRDILFFINAFCWTVNPMWHPDCPEQPFVTHPFQENAIRRLLASIGKHDIAFFKSRGMGASWMMLYVMLYRWMFFRRQSFLIVSRSQALVDNPKDMDALMPKIDFTLEHFPRWLRPKQNTNDRVELKNFNPVTGSIISGAATTGDIGRGGRRTAIAADEFAFFDIRDSYRAVRAITGATHTAWWISTPNGVGNAFHDIVKAGEIEQVELCWEDMPEKRKGLYRAGDDGRVEILDSAHRFPEEYPFVKDGLLRSVWYDAEERRNGGVRSLMAQEHDRDFLGSGSPFFDPQVLERLGPLTCPPTSTRTYVSDNGSKGRLALWLEDRASKCPPLDRCYVLGVDVSAGTGASNSCICVYDLRLREKVGELAEPKLDGRELADIAVQIGNWFEDWTETPALIVWEAQGVGITFGKRLQELAYPNLYYSQPVANIGELKKRMPGLWATKHSKQTLLKDYMIALSTGRFVERSEAGLKECHDFKYFASGKVQHYKEVTAEDPSGAKDNHGDRVVANALAVRGAASIGSPTPTLENAVETPYPSFYNEMRENQRRQREEKRIAQGWLKR